MQQISGDTRHLPLSMLQSMLCMQQLVVQSEIDAMQRYRIAIRKAKDGQTPFPTDIVEQHIASMLTWIQQSLNFFGESSLFPEAVDDLRSALLTTLHSSNEQVSSLLRQFRAHADSEVAWARQTLLTPLGTVEQAYDAIVQKQTVLGEALAELRQAHESVTHSTQHHSRLIPASADDEVQEDQEGILDETIHIYHLTVTCEPEHLDLILNHLSRLLAEHQSHASIVDVFDSAIRHETTLHFFSDDPIVPSIEEWLKKVDGVIDYSITQPSFHLIFEGETSICS